eukprot:scpid60958/ scgid22085/ 
MAKQAKLEVFDTGDFEEYAERLEFFFIANDIGQLASSANAAQKDAADKRKSCSTHLPAVSQRVYEFKEFVSSEQTWKQEVQRHCQNPDHFLSTSCDSVLLLRRINSIKQSRRRERELLNFQLD